VAQSHVTDNIEHFHPNVRYLESLPLPMILRNPGSSNHWLTVNTTGAPGNRDGIGARLRLVSGSGANQYATVTTGGSYFSASDKRGHFGLGEERPILSPEIEWPSGALQRLDNPGVGRIPIVREPSKGAR
jgi:hypothetical protein